MPNHAPPEPGCVHLTFDDGPDPDWTPRVLDLLAQAGAVATFFILGRSARAQPQLVRRILEAGHALGNHTFAHAHPWTLSTLQARHEVRDGASAIADVAGEACLWFRPPHGRVRRCMVDEALAHGQQMMLWSRSAVDWGPLGDCAGVARRLRAIEAGDVVLMHDAARGSNHPSATCAALPGLLEELRRRGLQPAAMAG